MSKRESRHVILRSLEELADYFETAEATSPPAADACPQAVEPASGDAAVALGQCDAEQDLGSLLAQLQQASASLAELVKQDQESRERAVGLLDQYDTLQGELAEAERAVQTARVVGQRAEALGGAALDGAVGAAAGQIAVIAGRAEAAASRVREERQTVLQDLARQPMLDRLLQERRREAAQEHERAVEAERYKVRAGRLAAVRAALAASRLEEAQALLGSLEKDYPDDAEVASLTDSIRRREALVKAAAADEALRCARRTYRSDPATAVALLERLDLAGLPEALARQIKGVWAAACARLCQERQITGLLRYMPQPAYGVVVAREAAGEYRVVSALGAARLAPGAAVDEGFVRRARPLRSTGR